MPEGQLPTSSATDPFSSILNSANASISNSDIAQALAPTTQRGPIQLPSYFTTPRAQVQPPAQMDHREVVGAGNARAQGIGNAVSAGVRTLGNFMAVRKNQQQAAESTKVQRFLAAQYEHDQAAQILQQDPKNAQALQAQQQAQNLMTGMLTDKKFATTLEKGFQISLTDPSQNKTDHHNIVQKGIELFKKEKQQPFTQEQAKQMAEKFRSQMPQQLGPNQFAMQRLGIMMEQRKDLIGLARSIMPAMIRADAAQKVEIQRGVNELAKMQGANQEWERRNAVQQSQLYQRLGVQQQLAFQRLDHENSLIIGRERTRLKDEGQNPNKLLHASDESSRTWASSIASLQTSLDMAQQTLATYKSSTSAKVDPAVVSQMQADIDIRTGELERSRRQASYYKNVYKVLGAKSGLPDQPTDSPQKEDPNASAKQPDGSAGTIDSNDLSDWASYTPQADSGGPPL